MDIHPPEHGIHTWKDFLVHMGTICLGLLIAIGLEQSVEAVHHRHQRRQLESDLRLEAKKNLILMDLDERYFAAMGPWYLAERKAVEAARDSGGKSKPAYVPRPEVGSTWWPDEPYWNIAKESASVGLLPRDEAGMFDLVYGEQQDIMAVAVLRYRDKEAELHAFENRFKDEPDASETPKLERMTAEDLTAYSNLLSDTLSEMLRARRGTRNAERTTRPVINGAKSDEELFRMLGGRPGDAAGARAGSH